MMEKIQKTSQQMVDWIYRKKEPIGSFFYSLAN